MKYHRHFIIEGRHLGTAIIGETLVHGTLAPPRSYAYFCPKCAEIWARCPVEENSEDWMVYTVQCKKHQYSLLEVSGSITLGWLSDYNETFPDEVVRWEFERHLHFYESITQGENE